MFQALGSIDHVLDRTGHRPRFPSVKKYHRDDRWQATVRDGAVVQLLAPDPEHVPDELKRRTVIDAAFVLEQRVDNHRAAVPEVEAEKGVGLRRAALAVDHRTLDMHRRALRIEAGDHLRRKIVVQKLTGAAGIGDEQAEEGVVPGAWQGHVWYPSSLRPVLALATTEVTVFTPIPANVPQPFPVDRHVCTDTANETRASGRRTRTGQRLSKLGHTDRLFRDNPLAGRPMPAKVGAAAILAAAIAAGILTFFAGERSESSLPEIAAPWTAPLPPVRPEQSESARDLARYLRMLPGDGNQGRVRQLTWTKFCQDRPIGNLHQPALRKLLGGHWFVHYTEAAHTEWQFKYFGRDGTLWTCRPTGFPRRPFTLQRYRYRIVDDLVGAATYVSVKEESGWPDAAKARDLEWATRPIVFDPVTGTFAIHHAGPSGLWYRHTGHMQRAYHPAFSALCPGIPRFGRAGRMAETAAVPSTYEGFRDSIGRRWIVRNVRTLFRQDPREPLTMGVYFALYPPPQAP